MADPVIQSVTGVPTSATAPGVPIPLTVVVTDADTRAVTLQFVVIDDEGHKSAPYTAPPFQIVDGVTLSPAPDTKIVSGGGTLSITGPLSATYTG